MKASKEALERYEDAVFALIMDGIMLEEGEALSAENERLKADPDFVIPEAADRRCLKTIRRAFRRQRRSHTFRTSWRVFQKVSVAAFVGALLFTGVYAASPELRSATLNLLIEVSNVSTSMRFVEEDMPIGEGEDLLPYEFGELPDGFTLQETGQERVKHWKYYTDGNGGKIELNVFDASDGMQHRFDTEEADKVEPLSVNGAAGRLVEKDGRISADVADEKHQIFVRISFSGLSWEDALNVVSNLVYTGNNF